MKKILSCVLLVISSVTGIFAQRNQSTINESWRFYKGDIFNASLPNLDDGNWEKVNLPHTWNATDAATFRNYYRGIGWYRKNLKGVFKEGKNYFVKFEGANQKAEIFLNGKKIGGHIGGYTGFNIDITKALDYSKNALNILAVKVDNAFDENVAPLSADFTFFGGIYRDVYLIETEQTHFAFDNLGSDGIFISTPLVNEKEAQAIVKGKITNEGINTKTFSIRNILYDQTGKQVDVVKQKIKANPNSIIEFKATLNQLKNPNLWSPTNPYLYQLTTQLVDDKTEQIIDELHSNIGFRWFSSDAENGFLLNGKPIKLMGAARHQDYPGIGNALSNDLNARDIKLLKEMGANFIRVSHYPQDQSVLDAVDRLGIIAWEEIPVVNRITPNEIFYKNAETNLKEMIRQNYNHPSIMFWGYSNEVMIDNRKGDTQENYTNFLVNYMKRLDSTCVSEDPSRLTTMAFHGQKIYNEKKVGDIPQVVGWNLYFGWYDGGLKGFADYLDEQTKLYPKRSLTISEYGAGSDQRLHSLKPEQFDFSMEYQQLYHEYYLPEINKRKNVVGATIWNLIDFGVASRQETMPRVNNKGMLYQNRIPKDVYYYYKASLSKEKVVYIASRDWIHRIGTPTAAGENFVLHPVKIYSNLPEVELFLNGKSLGKEKINNSFAIFNVPFINGKNNLMAIGENEISDFLSIDFEVQPLDLKAITGDFVLAVNAGSDCFYEDAKSKIIFQPDQVYRKGSWGFVGGNQFRPDLARPGIQSEITATDDDPIFQTMRENVDHYQFDVANGNYEVQLFFCEPNFVDQQGSLYDLGAKKMENQTERIFNVEINGTIVLTDLNIAKDYRSVMAIIKTYTIKVANDKGITVKLVATKGKPIISGIKLVKK